MHDPYQKILKGRKKVKKTFESGERLLQPKTVHIFIPLAFSSGFVFGGHAE
jgi:hypothetical protein